MGMMYMKKNKVVKNSKIKVKKDWNKIWLITLLILLALEVTLIPCLVYAEVKRVLPIIAFLVLLLRRKKKDCQRRIIKSI